MSEKNLLLILDAPMQAWSYQSYFDRRNTLAYPTRSALIGMFCAACGIDRGDTAGLHQLNPLKLEVLVYPKLNRGGNRVSYRRWVDYHTVGHGYDEKRFSLHIPISAEDKKKRPAVTFREYLADACFVVIVSGPEELLARVHDALCNPRWGIWFGRKCCVPALPICHGVFDSREAALERCRQIAKFRPMADRPLRTIREVQSFSEGTDTLLDTPVDFAARTFIPRRILDDWVTDES